MRLQYLIMHRGQWRGVNKLKHLYWITCIQDNISRVTIRIAAWNRNTAPNIGRTRQFTPDSSRSTRWFYGWIQFDSVAVAAHRITCILIIDIISKLCAFGYCLCTALNRYWRSHSGIVCHAGGITIELANWSRSAIDIIFIVTVQGARIEEGCIIGARLMVLCITSSTLIVTSAVTRININAITLILRNLKVDGCRLRHEYVMSLSKTHITIKQSHWIAGSTRTASWVNDVRWDKTRQA